MLAQYCLKPLIDTTARHRSTANIGFAALEMNKELGLSSQAFGLAAGLFFWGYFLFEVPSNLALALPQALGFARAGGAPPGARRWIARMRFLLGVAEAGFFPGIVVYLTYWFRRKPSVRPTPNG
ncbi:hypothetical protein [Streptomyces himastatinicus]|uniref:hypothetical protein n=1 Tax=Streptomyces himastatinicus TaxID=998084 RepID=UPI001BFFD7A9